MLTARTRYPNISRRLRYGLGVIKARERFGAGAQYHGNSPCTRKSLQWFRPDWVRLVERLGVEIFPARVDLDGMGTKAMLILRSVYAVHILLAIASLPLNTGLTNLPIRKGNSSL